MYLTEKNLIEKIEESTVNKYNSHNGVYIYNEEVVIRNGLIINNPFVKKIIIPNTVIWIFSNQMDVIKLSKFWLNQFNAYYVNVNDVLGYIIDYFYNGEDFKKNLSYSDSDYNIGSYVIGKLKYIIQTYIKEIEYIKPILDKSEINSGFIGSYNELYTYDTSTMELDEETLEYFEYLNEIFNDLDDYKDYFISYGYIAFNIKEFIFYSFLDSTDKKYSKEDKIEYVSSKMNVPKELVSSIFKDMKKLYSKKNRVILNLYEDIEELLIGCKNGWEIKGVN